MEEAIRFSNIEIIGDLDNSSFIGVEAVVRWGVSSMTGGRQGEIEFGPLLQGVLRSRGIAKRTLARRRSWLISKDADAKSHVQGEVDGLKIEGIVVWGIKHLKRGRRMRFGTHRWTGPLMGGGHFLYWDREEGGGRFVGMWPLEDGEASLSCCFASDS